MKYEVQDLKDDMIRWRRDLHQIPELELVLPKTVNYVSKVLDELEIPYKYLVNGNAIVGEIKGEQSGKVIGLRADMDGLPIVEETGLEFASKNRNMHACGHDGHTAMLLGAAKYLNSRKDEIKGTVKLLFQPGEEGSAGAKHMVEEGALKNPDVDAVFGLHEGNIGSHDIVGDVLFKKGAMMASTNTISIEVRGKGTHAAYPHNGIDPITIASELILEIQRMFTREISAQDTAVVSITSIHGGSAFNIIPEAVELKGTIRTINPEVRDHIITRLNEICEGIAKATRSTIKLVIPEGYPTTLNNPEFTEFAYNIAKDLYGESAKYMENAVMGGEDMAYFLREAKGTYAFLVNPKEIDGFKYPHHHPKFDVDENYFVKGATLLSTVAIKYLSEN